MAYVDNILQSIYALLVQTAMSQFLKSKRIAAGKTQVEVATDVFNDPRRQSDISALERGDRLPDLITLSKLRLSLGFSLGDIEDAVNSISPTQKASA